MSSSDNESYSITHPHSLDVDRVLSDLASTPQGLSEDEVAKRLAAVGPNRLPQPAKDGFLKRFFKHFHDMLIYVLLGAAAITGLLGHWVDTGVILGVVFINAIIGYIQEGKAEEALEGIRKMLSLYAQVLRDGTWQELEAEKLVPGDIVRLRSGDRVPADLRLMEVTNLRIEESALTGESVPADKTTGATDEKAGVGDRHGMAYSGSLVRVGRGTGVVTGTGAKTELGRINQMLSDVEPLATPLTRQMAAFGKTLSILIVILAGVMFGVGWFLHDYEMDELFFAAIGFAVAAIPEGLPAVLTITLALGVERMAGRKAITRKLSSVETLGSVTVICSDKTGTLTQNEMTVRHAVTRGGTYDIDGSGYAPEGKMTRDGAEVALDDHQGVRTLVEVMAVCNDSDIVEEDGGWKVNGEPTEGALVTWGRKVGFNRDEFERLADIPFESDNKFMATLNRIPDHGVRMLLKGAPDRLLERCSYQLGPNGDLEEVDRAFWESEMHQLGDRGFRVLAAAYRDVEGGTSELAVDDVEQEMVLVGLVGIFDPPRPEATEAIRICREAGIRVKMITGDHADTACAIGRDMGITDDDHAVTGETLEAASDEELKQLAHDHDVFARTSPEHKLRLVTALQANGEVVAMTGDGVNDAPALKRADVGVAMGIKGTEATKEAADIVLADDNFATIERAVEEGRTIYDNLRKAILFILPSNGAEALVILAAVIMGLSLPLTPVQILWVNMVTAVTLALALAFEPSEPGVMKRKPRKSDSPILGGLFLWRIGFVSALIGGATIAVYLIELRLGMEIPLARTVAVNTLVCAQVFYLFNSRFLYEASFRIDHWFTNRVAWLTVGVLAVLQMIFVYAPFMHHLFGSQPLMIRHWLIPLSVGFGVFVIIEIEKAILRGWRGRKE